MSNDLVKVDENLILSFSRDAKGLLDLIRGLILQDDTSFKVASSLVVQAQTKYKDLDRQRTDITKPILEAKRKVDQLFKPALDTLGELKDLLTAKINAYSVEQAAAQVLAMEADAASLANGQAPTAIVPDVPTAKGLSTKIVWDFEITDSDLVPAEYRSPDPDKIRRAVWYADTPTQPQPIPGVRFFQRGQTIVRSQRYART